jgi:hypothetical protein
MADRDARVILSFKVSLAILLYPNEQVIQRNEFQIDSDVDGTIGKRLPIYGKENTN